VLLLGCSTGNGLARVDPTVTRRLTGVDLNPEYLARLRDRFPDPGFELRLRARLFPRTQGVRCGVARTKANRMLLQPG
jgi:hypothetical protein